MAQVTKNGFLVKICYRKSIQIADSLDIMKANVHPVQIIQRLSRRKMVQEKMRVTSGTFIPVLPPSLPASCNHGDTLLLLMNSMQGIGKYPYQLPPASSHDYRA